MSIIVPAGKKNVEWSPKETKLQKTASDGQEAQDIEVDALYEAAKEAVNSAKEAEVKEAAEETEVKEAAEETEACGGAMMDDETAIIEVEEVGDSMEEAEEIKEDVEEAAETTEEEAVSDAVEKIEEACDEIKDAVSEESEAVADEASVEVEVPGEEIVDTDEVIVEGDECMASEKKEVKEASVTEEFCKFAKLSPANRKKLANYWVNMLGYPRDYVGLMTKDYEK